MRFVPRALAVAKDEKGLTLCEIRNNLTPFFLFTRPTYKLVQEGMEFYNKCYRQIPGLVKRVLLSPRKRPNNYSGFNGKCVGEYAVTLIMLHLKVILNTIPYIVP